MRAIVLQTVIGFIKQLHFLIGKYNIFSNQEIYIYLFIYILYK